MTGTNSSRSFDDADTMTQSLLGSIKPGPPARWPNKVSLTLDDGLLSRIDQYALSKNLGRAAAIRSVLTEHFVEPA